MSDSASVASGVPVYLIGNPNCGKTSLSIEKTGEHQHVGN
ncbi:MAG TPA: FeoB small GTPase domain-containing protein, partial [Candidatus Ozemobacteraceae bacterium]|nr:FeoB small GTPase domain-containing protein [Candidatus Ozemobacteraceae bacterium]